MSTIFFHLVYLVKQTQRFQIKIIATILNTTYPSLLVISYHFHEFWSLWYIFLSFSMHITTKLFKLYVFVFLVKINIKYGIGVIKTCFKCYIIPIMGVTLIVTDIKRFTLFFWQTQNWQNSTVFVWNKTKVTKQHKFICVFTHKYNHYR